MSTCSTPTSPTSPPTSPTSPPPPPTSSSSEFIFRVILSYGPTHEGQIPLTTGDVVTDVNDLGNGWTLGRNVTRDCAGIFPSRCIRPMSDVSPSQDQSVSSNQQQQQQPSRSGSTTPRTSRARSSRHPPPSTPPRRQSLDKTSGVPPDHPHQSIPDHHHQQQRQRPPPAPQHGGGGRGGGSRIVPDQYAAGGGTSTSTNTPTPRQVPRKVRIVEGDPLAAASGSSTVATGEQLNHATPSTVGRQHHPQHQGAPVSRQPHHDPDIEHHQPSGSTTGVLQQQTLPDYGLLVSDNEEDLQAHHPHQSPPSNNSSHHHNSSNQCCPNQQTQSPTSHAVLDPDLTPPSDAEYGSLTTPKRAAGGGQGGNKVPGKKPHLVVKPNQGGATNSNNNTNTPNSNSSGDARMIPSQDSLMREGGGCGGCQGGERRISNSCSNINDADSPHRQHQQQQGHCGPSHAAAAGGKSVMNGGGGGGGGMTRTVSPPAHLGPLTTTPQHATGPHRRLIRNVTDAEKVVVVTSTSDPQQQCQYPPAPPCRRTVAEVGPRQDRSTSPITVDEHDGDTGVLGETDSGLLTGLESGVGISVSVGPLSYDGYDRDNLANEETLSGVQPAETTTAAGQMTPRTMARNLQHQQQQSEKYASINKPYYRDYRTLECPPDGNYATQLRYKPILKNRHQHGTLPHHAAPHHHHHHHHQKVADSKGQHVIYYRPDGQGSSADDNSGKGRTCRLIVSTIVGLCFGSTLFKWLFFYLHYPLYVSLGVGAAGALTLILCLALSRMCRCTTAILFPSLCTTRGRIAFLLLITGFQLGGPVTNVYHNMREVSRSMSCSAEQSYNQTMLLLQPFDAMMIKLNETVVKLQQSAFEVHRGLRPLEEGLNKVEMDIDNGRIQLQGTRKTCMSLVDNAYTKCEEGIESAKNKCLGVIEALGKVYLLTRSVLEQINPEHWAPKHHLLLKKRQVLLEGSNPELNLPSTDKDMCEQLDLGSLCQSLNDSRTLCLPSNWAGEAIQEAVNLTQAAMHSLEQALHFEVSSEPYNTTRIKASRMIYEVQMSVQRDFLDKTTNFDLIISVVLKVIPISVLLLVYVAYNHVKHYLCSDTYDNTYVTRHFKSLDLKRSEVAGESLLPLKQYERNYLVESTASELSPPEHGLYRVGLCVLILHFLVTFTCYAFDYILYWIMALIRRHAHPTFDATGRDSLEMVVSGEGVIVELLDVFLKGFHPGEWFGYRGGGQRCLATPREPPLEHLIVIILMYFVLFITIVLKAYFLRFRNDITGYFYPERRKARTVHLYNVILGQRARMPRLLQTRARRNHRERTILDDVSCCQRMAGRCRPFRIFADGAAARCLVCGAPEDQAFRDCETERCGGVYCADCHEDLGRMCPLCLHNGGVGQHGPHGAELSDDDDDDMDDTGGGPGEGGVPQGGMTTVMTTSSCWEDYEDLENDLQPYHRSSKIYL